MTNSIKYNSKNIDSKTSVEDDLIEDFEQVNFGAKTLGLFEEKLKKNSLAISDLEEKQSKLRGKKEKKLRSKTKKAQEEAEEKSAQEIENTLSPKNIYHHAPTFRNK